MSIYGKSVIGKHCRTLRTHEKGTDCVHENSMGIEGNVAHSFRTGRNEDTTCVKSGHINSGAKFIGE